MTVHSRLRTTTLHVGPFAKPLTGEVVALLAAFVARAVGRGFAVMRSETDTHVSIVAVITAPITQPFTRSSDLVPGAVVTALVGEATAAREA